MNFGQILAVGTLLAFSAVATAEFTTVERANEVLLSNLELPASANGVISFKACSACERQTVRVDAETRYRLNDRLVPLSEFRRALSVVTNRQEQIAAVMHHLESDRVTLISIRL
jgi:hypothetical protein